MHRAISEVWRLLSGLLRGTTGEDDGRRRAVFFALAVVALLVAARSGGSQGRFWLALAVFSAAATLWVRGQYVHSLRSEPGRDGLAAQVALLSLAFGLVLAYLLSLHAHQPVGGLLLGGLVVGYTAVGGLIQLWRRCRPATVLGHSLVLGAAAVVLSFAGYHVLTTADTGRLALGVLLLALGLLVCWPIFVALSSERAIVFFAGDNVARLRGVAMIGGLLGYVALVVVIGLWTHSVPMVIGLGALGALIVSVASSTRADIVLVIAVLGLMGFSPRDSAAPVVSDHPTRPVLLALGDSYMSGEGASVFYRGTDVAGRDTCRRAPTAWAELAGRLPPFGGGTIFLACSGAVTANVRLDTPSGSALDPPRAQTGETGTQLQQAREELAAHPDLDVDLVVLSLGGNDAGFSTIGTMCLVNGDCSTKSSWWSHGLDDVGRALDDTYSQVRATFPNTPVVVVPYPEPIYQPATTAGDLGAVKTCHQVALRDTEQAFIASFVDRLDSTVETQAEAHGFYYLSDMHDALRDAGLQLCDPRNDGRPGLNFIGLRSVGGLAEQRFNPANWTHNSLHPNELGHRAMLQTFERWYAAHAPLQATAVSPGVASPTAGADADASPAALLRPVDDGPVAPVCSPLDPTPSGCRSLGTHWAVGQVADGLVSPRAGVMVLACLLCWLGVLAFFGWRRRLWAEADPSPGPSRHTTPHQKQRRDHA